MKRPRRVVSAPFVACLAVLAVLTCGKAALAGDLPEIKKAGVLRHLGIPYANFVTGAGDGMDVEIMQLFATELGVRYEYVKTDWGTVVEDLVGRKVKAKGDEVEFGEATPVRGDLVANGFTILPWRQKVVDFSTPTFPSQIWLVARADSKVRPIKPSGNIDGDIATIRALLNGKKVLALKKTCLDPDLYRLSETGARIVLFQGQLNELAPALVNNEAELTILDVPDALIALDKWPGKLKILGPISRKQEMGVGFPKGTPQLRAAYNAFLEKLKGSGNYDRIVKKYFPTAYFYFPEFFKR
jgi:ABC-type amino acid transport substrate-binding protein